MDTHTTNGSQAPKPDKRTSHNLAIDLPKGLLPVSLKDLLQILPIEQLNVICHEVMNGFKYMPLSKIPYLVDFPGDMNLQYGEQFFYGQDLRICLIMEKQDTRIEIVKTFVFEPERISIIKLTHFMENYLTATKLRLHEQ